MQRIVILLMVLGTCSLAAAETIPPSPSPHYIVDEAQALSPGVVSRIDQQLAGYEQSTSNQIIVAVYPTMQSDDDIAAYAVRVAQAWKIGQKDKNNGILVLVFIADRKMTIQVGYGLEGALPDATAKMIIEQEIKPHFKAGDYDGGIQAGVNAIIAATRGEYKGNGKTRGSRQTGLTSNDVTAIVIGLAIFFSIVSSFFQRRGTMYSSNGRSFWWTMLWILSNSGGNNRNDRWGGGGGGGGGGFSGGGGSFGGGGASGSW